MSRIKFKTPEEVYNESWKKLRKAKQPVSVEAICQMMRDYAKPAQQVNVSLTQLVFKLQNTITVLQKHIKTHYGKSKGKPKRKSSSRRISKKAA